MTTIATLGSRVRFLDSDVWGKATIPRYGRVVGLPTCSHNPGRYVVEVRGFDCVFSPAVVEVLS